MTTDAQLRYLAACFAAFGHNDLAARLQSAANVWRYPHPADEKLAWREAFERIVGRFDALPGKARRGSTQARCADLWRKALRAVTTG